MASLKEIKSRINSVNGTLKITSAMKMVASAKLRKAQTAIENMLPYQKRMQTILTHLLSDESAPEGSAFAAERPVRKVAIVAVASNSSLCGAFNSNAIKLFHETVQECLDSGLSKEDITVFAVGRKMADAASKSGFPSQGDFSSLADRHVYNDVAQFADRLIEGWQKGAFDRIILVYNHFKSSSSQLPTCETYLPFSVSTAAGGSEMDSGYLADYIIEPDAQTVLELLMPKVLVLKIYTMLLDANAAEHAARTVAMQEATDNGNKLRQELTLQYNKQRQQSITEELLDIVSGSLA